MLLIINIIKILKGDYNYLVVKLRDLLQIKPEGVNISDGKLVC